MSKSSFLGLFKILWFFSDLDIKNINRLSKKRYLIKKFKYSIKY